MRVETYKCDVCGSIKADHSHWFRADFPSTGLQLNAWEGLPATATSLDLCSDSCVTKTVQKWLDHQVHANRQADRLVRAIVDSVGVL